MKTIDLESWERKSHYTWFSSFADPSLSMDVRMNITNLLRYCKEKRVSSFAAIMYILCRELNRSRAFRLRVLGGQIVEIEYANVAYTVMVNESCFVNCRARTHLGFSAFVRDVNGNREKYVGSNYVQQEYNDVSVVDDIYCSCVPWVDFTGLRQPVPDHIPESKSIPRVCWGKYVSQGEEMFMTLNITANHALVDGVDFANVLRAVQSDFDAPETVLND